MPQTPVSVLLKQEVKPSDLVPLTLVGTQIFFITESTTGVEESILVANAANSSDADAILEHGSELKGPRVGVEFTQPGANRILRASFIVGTNDPVTSVIPSIQVQ